MKELLHQCNVQVNNSFFTSNQWFELFGKYVNHNKDNFNLEVTSDHGTAYFSCDKKPKNAAKTLESMSNYYSPIYGLAGESIYKCPCKENIKKHKSFFASFDYINIVPLYKEQAQEWCSAFSAIGYKGFLYQHSVNWFENNITSVEEYWKRRPSKLKNTLKRKQELMQKDAKFNIRIVNDNDDKVFMQALIDYHQVYYHSWKRSEPTPAFIDSLCEYHWKRNTLRMGVIYYDDTPIAAQIWFLHNNTAKIFKLAYHKDFTRFSPGTVLTAKLLEYVISQDKVTNIDFLTGNDDYKKDWMSDKQTLYGVQLCNTQRWRGKVRALLNYLSDFKSK